MTEDDELFGEFMTDGVYEALRHVPLAAVRRAFPEYPAKHVNCRCAEARACDHHNAQLYRRKEWHYCPDCGEVVER